MQEQLYETLQYSKKLPFFYQWLLLFICFKATKYLLLPFVAFPIIDNAFSLTAQFLMGIFVYILMLRVIQSLRR